MQTDGCRAMGREHTPANVWSRESFGARDRPGTLTETQMMRVVHLSLNFRITPVGSRPCVQKGHPHHKVPVLAASLATGLPLTSTFSTMAPTLPPPPRNTHTPPFCFCIDFTTSEKFLTGERAYQWGCLRTRKRATCCDECS